MELMPDTVDEIFPRRLDVVDDLANLGELFGILRSVVVDEQSRFGVGCTRLFKRDTNVLLPFPAADAECLEPLTLAINLAGIVARDLVHHIPRLDAPHEVADHRSHIVSQALLDRRSVVRVAHAWRTIPEPLRSRRMPHERVTVDAHVVGPRELDDRVGALEVRRLDTDVRGRDRVGLHGVFWRHAVVVLQQQRTVARILELFRLDRGTNSEVWEHLFERRRGRRIGKPRDARRRILARRCGRRRRRASTAAPTTAAAGERQAEDERPSDAIPERAIHDPPLIVSSTCAALTARFYVIECAWNAMNAVL